MGRQIVLNQEIRQEEPKGLPPPVTSSGHRKVSGIVTDEKGEPIIGATIVVAGTSEGTVSDLNGKFSIGVSGSSILEISYIGYNSQNIRVDGETNLSPIVMKENTQYLNELVVTAYGTQIRKDVTGAIGTIDLSDLKDIPGSQFTQKLQGQIAGVQIEEQTGAPGQGINVKIRGAASLSTGSNPLYVVDGFPIVGNINNINPSEIESISVLKDAAATTLYGSRAAFGVVLVTTKQAKGGKTSVEFNGYTGLQSVPQKGRPDMMDGEEWAEFRKENYSDLGVGVPEVYQDPSSYGKGTDWYDAMLRTGLINDYNVAIRGGSDKFSTSVVIGYFGEGGVVRNSSYNRISVRANTMYKISPTLTAQFSIAPTYSWENRQETDGLFSEGGLLYNALLTSPILTYKDKDGNMPVNITTSGITQVDTPNWVRSIEDTRNRYNTGRLLTDGSLEYRPIRDLKLKTSVSADLGAENHHYFVPSTAGRKFAAAASEINATLTNSDNRYWSWLWENTATYKHAFGDHHLEALVGYTMQKYHYNYSEFSGSDFTDDRVATIDAALVKNTPTEDIQEWSMISYLGRINYDFKERYLLSTSIRRDGSSRFGSDNKWGNFSAISLGWLVNEEKFMDFSKDWLSMFKIRASYGTVGNNNIGNYTQYNVLSDAKVVFGNTTENGVQVTRLGNSDLGWEKTGEFDFGVDLSFLNSRITFTYDYYNKITRNLLYSLSVPQESGFSNFMGNVGKIKFWGHELGLVSHNLTGEFKWNTNFNISIPDNRVLELSGLSDHLIAYTSIFSTITKVGGKIGQFYGMVQDGVYKNQEDYDSSPKGVDSEVGTIKFRDINGDGKITYNDENGDKTIIGDPFPDFTFGFTNYFSWKNFDLNIVTTGSVGNDVVSAIEQGTMNLDGIFNVLKDVKYRWRSAEDPGDGKYGKSTSDTGRERDQFSTRYIKDGSYFAIEDITIGYTF
ncbi:MAG TPA: SusC/RagA family TonB-linked outer membrane protein, partial [Prevotella sp.]|nr:SusC/RagA family TonB-linked outer membrane protein [Prevotella sp.]